MLELGGKSFKIPVTRNATVSQINNSFPTAFDVPKYFFADSSVMISELGADNALLRSPYTKAKLKTSRKPRLPATHTSSNRFDLSSPDITLTRPNAEMRAP